MGVAQNFGNLSKVARFSQHLFHTVFKFCFSYCSILVSVETCKDIADCWFHHGKGTSLSLLPCKLLISISVSHFSKLFPGIGIRSIELSLGNNTRFISISLVENWSELIINLLKKETFSLIPGDDSIMISIKHLYVLIPLLVDLFLLIRIPVAAEDLTKDGRVTLKFYGRDGGEGNS